MSLFLVIIGILLLLVCLTGVAIGAYMSTDPKNRDSGRFFAVWWVSGAAGASGVIMRDGVTVLTGTLCFLVAGATFFAASTPRRVPADRRRDRPGGDAPEGSEKTTKEIRSNYRKAAS